MAVDSAWVDHCVELLSPLGSVRPRRMFGGHGFYVDGLFVALAINEVLYLKADAQVQPQFDAAGCRPFEYTVAGGRRAVMAYWSAPDEATESPAGMLPWARLALASALRAAASKPVPKKSAPAAKPRKPKAKTRTAAR